MLIYFKKLATFFCISFPLLGFAQSQEWIYPGEIWPDQNGNHVQVHGGGIIKINETYYWYGEQRRLGLDSNKRYVSCYTSKNLISWTFNKDVLQLTDPENLGRNWVCERPKVFYNSKTKKYVMYLHLDDNTYKLARVAVAVSDVADGEYKYVKSFRPLGCESRDIGQFIDDDGQAYLIFEDRPSGFHIAKLSDDYLDVEKDMGLIKIPMEGGALVHYQGLYYAIGSALSGWAPNPNKYATATSLNGPWSIFKNIAPPQKNTYGSQSTFLLKVVGTKKTSVIFMGDIWRPKMQSDSRYLWMPLQIGDGKLWLPEPRPWKINLKTGETSIKKYETVKNKLIGFRKI
jgi:Glycosyl hydrolases family 43